MCHHFTLCPQPKLYTDETADILFGTMFCDKRWWTVIPFTATTAFYNCFEALFKVINVKKNKFTVVSGNCLVRLVESS